MDPKGDRERKLKMGVLKLPEAVLKNTIEAPVKSSGSCLEGSSRPKTEQDAKKGMNILNSADIPLPSDADIPLPRDADIPLPSSASIPLPSLSTIRLPDDADIPLPNDADIPLPSDASIPLPADKPPEKTKITRIPLDPKGDELVCWSCSMKFGKQFEYDTHLQSDGHQQVIFG